MKKTTLPLLLLVSFSLLPSSLHAQSNRKPAEPKKEQQQPAKPAEPNEGINESRISPEGETVDGDVIRFDTSLVMVPVTVIDRNGKYVPQLRREQFRLMENGVEQKIAYFAKTDAPFSVVLLIDASGSTQFRLEDIQKAAMKFVEKLKPADSVTVISFEDHIEVMCKATTDREVINNAIRRTQTGSSTRLYDAVENVLSKQLRTIPGRKAVVLFTDGVDTMSQQASYDSTIRLAEEADAPIYSVNYDTSSSYSIHGGRWPTPGGRGTILGAPGPLPGATSGGAGASPEDYRRAVSYLKALSAKTAGRFYNGDSLSSIDQAFTRIAEELGRQYSLGYYPDTHGQAGERRQIKVKVTEVNLVVKSRDGYIYSDKSRKFTQFTRPNP